MKSRSRGFTIVELMVTLSIAALILAIGAPSFNEFRRNNRLTGTANDFLGAVQTARTEAIKRQLQVSVCPSANPNDASPTCTNGLHGLDRLRRPGRQLCPQWRRGARSHGGSGHARDG